MSSKPSVLVVDDDYKTAELLAESLSALGYQSRFECNPMSALRSLKTGNFQVLILDLVMPELDGMKFLEIITEESLSIIPIVLTAYSDVPHAVEAMRRGAFDFIAKPAELHHIDCVIQRALAKHDLIKNARLNEKSLREWEAIFNAFPEYAFVVDDCHRIVKVNRAVCEKLNTTAEKLVGKCCYETIHGYTSPPQNCPIGSLRDNGFIEHVETFDKLLLGGVFHISSGLIKSNGTISGVVHLARDISSEQKLQMELKTTNEEMERLLSSLTSFLIGLDADLHIVRWNKAAEDLFQLDYNEVVGKHIQDLNIPWNLEKQTSYSTWFQLTAAKRLEHVHFTRADGSERILGITVHPMRDKEDQTDGVFLLGTDITERLHMESQLAQSQKLESIGQLAAGIAHEINTPTQYVGDNIEFLSEAFAQLSKLIASYNEVMARLPQDELVRQINDLQSEIDFEYLKQEIPKALQQSREGVNRVASIVRAMKEFSHPGVEEKTRVDLNHCIMNTITVSRNEWKYVADLETNLDPSLPLVNCLPGEFNQVILNIIVNAAHAIRDVVGDGSKGKGKITVTSRQDEGYAEVRISDTGTGIPYAIRNRIFDPFFTTKEVGKGTGQGLAIARNVIVDKHKGTITFETQEGVGTTFIIRIPIDGT